MDKYDLHENTPVGRTLFHMVRTRTSFDAEAKGNSGMAYQLVNTIFSRVEQNSWHTFCTRSRAWEETPFKNGTKKQVEGTWLHLSRSLFFSIGLQTLHYWMLLDMTTMYFLPTVASHIWLQRVYFLFQYFKDLMSYQSNKATCTIEGVQRQKP